MIGIINYGVGNIRSITNSLDKVDKEWGIIEKKVDFEQYSHFILPGVGAFAAAMEQLIKNDFLIQIEKYVKKGNPFLGLCVGMQLLFDKSEEEGPVNGLGLIKGEVLSLSKKVSNTQVPHVGWNDCKEMKKSGFSINHSFYFTHSYFCQCEDKKDVLTETEHGISFHSAVQKDNLYGFQFHPEKSHSAGINLLKSFAELKC